MKNKVTVQEIADFVGVSKFAVSRALAGKSGVSENTRDTILKAAGQLGYFNKHGKRHAAEVLHDQARQLQGGSIVVLFPNIRYQNRDSLYWGPIFDGISERLKQKGLDILTLTEPTTDHVFSVLKPEAIHGVITVGAVSTSLLLDIAHLGIPVVMVDHLDPALRCDTIFTDNFTLFRDMMIKLISKGYKRFQFVGNMDYAHSFYERWVAYRSILEQYRLNTEQISGLLGSKVADIHTAIEHLSEDELPELFVCVNDITAQFVIEALMAKGIEMPGRCAVTGFDHIHDSLPLLATVEVDKELMGQRAVDQILWRIANPAYPPEKLLMNGNIIFREQ